jgi:hypothetical protein|nr:MAG TPA: hypothetical protein [Caudoviricetes sp.]
MTINASEGEEKDEYLLKKEEADGVRQHYEITEI